MVLPVKVTIEKGTHLTHTVDITPIGARLGAFRTKLQSGMIISLQRGSKKAKFRIAWIRKLAPTELQARVKSLGPENNFWGVDLSDQGQAKNDTQVLMTFVSTYSKRLQ